MKYADEDKWKGLTGIYLEIAYVTATGGMKYEAVLTDAQARFEWTPPAGVTEVFFRTMNRAHKAFVLIYEDDLPGADGFEPLWTPEDHPKFTQIDVVNGCLRGRVVHAPAAHEASKFQYEYLKPDVTTLPILEEEDVPLKLIKLKLSIQPVKPRRKHRRKASF